MKHHDPELQLICVPAGSCASLALDGRDGLGWRADTNVGQDIGLDA